MLNIVFDGVFFKQRGGVIIFRSNGVPIFFKEITSETIEEISVALKSLNQVCPAGYKSFTIDGRRGVKNLLLQLYPNTPVQYCIFHQKKTIIRYVSRRPKTDAGKWILGMVINIKNENFITFSIRFRIGEILFTYYLREQNSDGRFEHKRLRSAFRSLKTNIPWLFTYKQFPELNIPSTTNSCDGSFTYLKRILDCHRGLESKRFWKLLRFLIIHQSRNLF